MSSEIQRCDFLPEQNERELLDPELLNLKYAHLTIANDNSKEPICFNHLPRIEQKASDF